MSSGSSVKPETNTKRSHTGPFSIRESPGECQGRLHLHPNEVAVPLGIPSFYIEQYEVDGFQFLVR
jgi:hypothetical protein